MSNQPKPPSAPAKARHCETHLPPFDLKETPDINRKGWYRCECRRGKFIGYRQSPDAWQR